MHVCWPVNTLCMALLRLLRQLSISSYTTFKWLHNATRALPRGAKGTVYGESITYRDKAKVCLGPELRPLWLVWPTSQNFLKDTLSHTAWANSTHNTDINPGFAPIRLRNEAAIKSALELNFPLLIPPFYLKDVFCVLCSKKRWPIRSRGGPV